MWFPSLTSIIFSVTRDMIKINKNSGIEKKTESRGLF